MAMGWMEGNFQITHPAASETASQVTNLAGECNQHAGKFTSAVSRDVIKSGRASTLFVSFPFSINIDFSHDKSIHNVAKLPQWTGR